MAKEKTTISFQCSKEDLERIKKRMEIMGFSSQSEYVRYLLTLGELVESMMLDARQFDHESFTNAFFTVGRRLIQKGTAAMMEAQVAEGIAQWALSEYRTPVLHTGHVIRPNK